MNKYARAFAAAMDRSGIRNTVVAAHVEIGNNSIAQWRTGRRPIPAEHALKVAGLLSIPPEVISEAYARLLKVGAVLPGALGPGTRTNPPATHVVIERLEGFGRTDGPDSIWLPEFMVKRELGLIPMENIRWATQLSKAMEPEIKRHALVLVDISENRHEDVVDGGIFAYSLWDRPDIRRVTIRRDTWVLVGNQQDRDRTPVAKADLGGLQLFGAVVGWF